MTGLDFLLIAAILAGLTFVGWVAYNVGHTAARREYQAALATERATNRRLRERVTVLSDDVATLRRARLRAIPPQDPAP